MGPFLYPVEEWLLIENIEQYGYRPIHAFFPNGEVYNVFSLLPTEEVVHVVRERLPHVVWVYGYDAAPRTPQGLVGPSSAPWTAFRHGIHVIFAFEEPRDALRFKLTMPVTPSVIDWKNKNRIKWWNLN